MNKFAVALATPALTLSLLNQINNFLNTVVTQSIQMSAVMLVID